MTDRWPNAAGRLTVQQDDPAPESYQDAEQKSSHAHRLGQGPNAMSEREQALHQPTAGGQIRLRNARDQQGPGNAQLGKRKIGAS
jgi:hypothetical protein